MRRAGILAIHDFVEILGILNVSRVHDLLGFES
jgi:hypothetical protein